MSNFANAARAVSQVFPVVWFQLEAWADERAAKRDEQIMGLDGKVLEVKIVGLANREDVLIGRQFGLGAALRLNPNDATLLKFQVETDASLKTVQQDLRLAECQLKVLQKLATHCALEGSQFP